MTQVIAKIGIIKNFYVFSKALAGTLYFQVFYSTVIHLYRMGYSWEVEELEILWIH
jgi:hypothetical protein